MYPNKDEIEIRLKYINNTKEALTKEREYLDNKIGYLEKEHELLMQIKCFLEA